MKRLFGSVRAQATIGATLVVAVALIAAGTAVLLSLRSNLIQEAAAQADATARQVASKVAARTAYEDLDLPDDEDRPVQVVDSRGRLLAVSEDLERISGTGTDAVRPDPEALREPGGGNDDDDDGERLEAGEISDEVERGEGTATVDGHTADYRFSAVEVENDDDRLTVWAGAPLAAEQGAVSTAQTVMLIGLPLLLVVVAGVTWGVTGRALKPVEGIRREMAAITASEDLGLLAIRGPHHERVRLLPLLRAHRRRHPDRRRPPRPVGGGLAPLRAPRVAPCRSGHSLGAPGARGGPRPVAPAPCRRGPRGGGAPGRRDRGRCHARRRPCSDHPGVAGGPGGAAFRGGVHPCRPGRRGGSLRPSVRSPRPPRTLRRARPRHRPG
ncbi:hypothetical protein ACWEO9_29850, partial [Streptomyces albidoflavus]